MERYFNITGCCNPQEHYMVNLDSRLAQIKKMVDKGQYFCINRGRQYGKTTLLEPVFIGNLRACVHRRFKSVAA